MAAASSRDEDHFMDRYWGQIIQNITMINPVLDDLQQSKLLTREHCFNVMAEKTPQDQMRRLLSYSRGWSFSDKDNLGRSLREHNPGVLENLEDGNANRQPPDQWKRTNVSHKDGFRMKYMSKMKQKYQLIREHNSRPGEKIDLEDRYTSLLMIRNTRSKEERGHEITALGAKHLQLMDERSSEEYSPTTIQALFDPNPKGIFFTAVVLQGPAGIGKTMTSQKIMLDWASGNLYQDKFNFLFLLSCRELNTITGHMSLARLLSRACGLNCPDDVMKSILRDSEKLLFIVDGFDELKWSLEDVEEDCEDPFQETSINVLLKSLLTKQCLYEAFLVITTRPLALKNLDDFIKDHRSRFVDILGFTGEERQKYVHNFFENTEDAEKALSIIKDNDYLCTLCAVPIMSWMACTLITQEIKKDLGLLSGKTTTSFFLFYLEGLINYHGGEDEGSKQLVRTSLKKLCALANKGILNRQILFEEEDLEELLLSKFKSVFVNENIFHQGIGTWTCYSFIHLSVQEFFAALYYVLDDSSGNEENSSLPEVCKGNSFSDLCSDYPHLALVVRFLFGLLHENVVKEFSKSTKINISLPDRSAMAEWIIGDIAPSAISIEAVLCLYETQDVEVIRRVMAQSCFIFGPIRGVTPLNMKNYSKELCYCLKVCGSIKNLSLKHLTIDPETLKMLCPFIQDCQQLSLEYCYLSSSCCEDLRSVLITNRSLNKLDLSVNPLQDSGVKLLHEGLRDQRCSLKQLNLKRCGLTSLCCEDLRSVLIKNRSLRKLDLSEHYLQDSGIKLVCEGLMDPGCTLQDLSLKRCQLTTLCCKDLRSVLIKNRSLRKLDLSYNDLQGSGIKLLCDGLLDRRCNLQDLSLKYCGLSSSCCEDLLSVLIINRSLKKLDLSGNDLQGSGIILVCEGLMHPGCTLQDLSLEFCDLTSLCCEDLRYVLIKNRSLRKLDLSWNNLQDSGIKLVCEGLMYPGCTLQDLRVVDCSGTSLSCDRLRSVISTNRTLTRLETTLRADRSEEDQIVAEFQRLGCSVKWISYLTSQGHVPEIEIIYRRAEGTDDVDVLQP